MPRLINDEPAPLRSVCSLACVMTYDSIVELADRIEINRSCGHTSKKAVTPDVLMLALKELSK